MPIATILLLTTIIAMFIAFGAVLAWAEYQTRRIGRRVPAAAAQAAPYARTNVVKIATQPSARSDSVIAGGRNTPSEVTNRRPPRSDQASARLG